jgi:hypothetical protein
MHLFFDLVCHGKTLPDYKGIEIANVKEALQEALSSLGEMREEDPATAGDWDGCELKISDASGVLLTSVALDDPALRPRARSTRPGLASGH